MGAIQRGFFRFICGIADQQGLAYHLKISSKEIFPDYELDKKHFDIVLTSNGKVVAIFNILNSRKKRIYGEELKDFIKAVDEDGHDIQVYTLSFTSNKKRVFFSSKGFLAFGDKLIRFPYNETIDFWKTFDPDGYDYSKHMIGVVDGQEHRDQDIKDEDQGL